MDVELEKWLRHWERSEVYLERFVKSGRPIVESHGITFWDNLEFEARVRGSGVDNILEIGPVEEEELKVKLIMTPNNPTFYEGSNSPYGIGSYMDLEGNEFVIYEDRVYAFQSSIVNSSDKPYSRVRLEDFPGFNGIRARRPGKEEFSRLAS